MKQVLLCGAGHAHLPAVEWIPRYRALGARVAVVSRSPFHYYSGMGAGLLSGTYTPDETRFDLRRMVESRGGVFVQDRVVGIDADGRCIRLAGGGRLTFDVASFNLGSEPSTGTMDLTHGSVLPVRPLENLNGARALVVELARASSEPLALAVVGGGAAGVEIAGGLCALALRSGLRTKITLVSRGPILPRFPGSVRRAALKSMARRGITVLEGGGVAGNTADTLILTDGGRLPFQLALVAMGGAPASLFRDAGLTTGPDGGLLVDHHLQTPGYPYLFGGGDCISFRDRTLDKVGVYAVREGPILAANLAAWLDGKTMSRYVPQTSYLQLVNQGDGTALHNRRSRLSGSRYAFWLKDRIDREFMARFSAPARGSGLSNTPAA